MPYVRCPSCGLTAYSAAAWSGTDRCGSCDAPLPRAARGTGQAVVGALPSRRDARERRWSESVLGEALRELRRH